MDNTREKLIELIEQKYYCSIEELAEHLIANGVTVQEGKPLEAFLHPIDAYKGLKAKYLVFKADTGAKVDNCFILRPDRDTAAVDALRTYANFTDNETLAVDIYNWVGKGEPVQEWIPVTERLPKREDANLYESVLAINKEDGVPRCWMWDIVVDYPKEFTHWMPLPQPPKGE